MAHNKGSVLFTMGTDDKSNMEIDELIGNNSNKNRGPRISRQRKHQMAQNAKTKAVQVRQTKIERMRGVQSSTTGTEKQSNGVSFRVKFPDSPGGSRLNFRQRGQKTDDGVKEDKAWLRQQRLREQQQKKKLSVSGKGSTAKSNNNSASTGGFKIRVSADQSTVKPFQFETPSFLSTNNNNNTNQQGGNAGRQRGGRGQVSNGGEARRVSVKLNTMNAVKQKTGVNRAIFKERQQKSVATKRGIVQQEQQNNTNTPKTLNERFGSSHTAAPATTTTTTTTTNRQGRGKNGPTGGGIFSATLGGGGGAGGSGRRGNNQVTRRITMN